MKELRKIKRQPFYGLVSLINVFISFLYHFLHRTDTSDRVLNLYEKLQVVMDTISESAGGTLKIHPNVYFNMFDSCFKDILGYSNCDVT